MKKILVACNHFDIDAPLRRSLAHLAKSCRVVIARDGFCAFDEIKSQAFDLIIIDSELPGIDSLEVIEGIQHVDPGVPVILILKQSYRGVWQTVRQFEAHPIMRPFKPLRFLRLADKLLHQHLNHYRQLADRLGAILEMLADQTGAACTFLTEESGQVLVAQGKLAGISTDWLGSLAADSFSMDGEIQLLPPHNQNGKRDSRLAQDYGLYVTSVAHKLHLALVTPHLAGSQGSPKTWDQIEAAAGQIKVALYAQLRTDISSSGQRNNGSSHSFVRLKPNFGDQFSTMAQEEDDIAANWEIISHTSTLLNRLDEFCRIK